MASINDVQTEKLILQVAQKLKGMANITPPTWAAFVKTGPHKERVPTNPDWWFVRSAAVLRSVGKLGPIGVAKLRTKYGGKKNRGHKPDKFVRASGNILRKVLQQLEKEELIKQTKIGIHSGRVLTPKGQSLLEKTASEILKQSKQK